MRDSFDPTLEQQNVILVDAAALRESEKLIESCEHCHPATINSSRSRPCR
jgi:hypothetical protein